MDESQDKKPRIVEIRRPTQLPAPDSTQTPTLPPASSPERAPSQQRDNPIARAMQEEALRDMRAQSLEPMPRSVSQQPSLPPIERRASSAVSAQQSPQPLSSPLPKDELMRKIEVDRVTRKAGVGSRISTFFGNLFKGKKKEKELGLLDK